MTDQQQTPDGFREWVILECMGHKKLAGLMQEEEIAGQPFLRIDVPSQDEDDGWAGTQFYSASAVYCITPTTEDIARRLAAEWWEYHRPITHFDLPALPATTDTAEGAEEVGQPF